MYERQPNNRRGRADEELLWATTQEDEEPFLPLRLFYGGRSFGPRDRHEWHHERAVAERANGTGSMGGARPGPGRTPGRMRGLSRADIVDVAVAIADAEGTEAVSMRRIARDLRVGAMSLYWHVESKEELHQLMLDTVQAEIEAPTPSGDWRTDLAAYASNTRAALLRHPWAIDFLNTGPPSGPNDARNAERLIGALDGLGLDVKTTMWIAARRSAPTSWGPRCARFRSSAGTATSTRRTERHDRGGGRRAARRVRAADPRVRALPAPDEDLGRELRPGRAGDER